MHKVWDKESIRSFIETNFDNRTLAAYDKLKPYAFKADLARYCLAYVYGGWYFDINIEMVSNPSIKEIDMLLIRDYNNGTNLAPWQVANGLFYSVAKHQSLKNAIDIVIENVEKDFYGKFVLSVTGPEVFGKAISDYGFAKNDTRYLIGDFVDNSDKTRKQFIVNGSVIAIHKTTSGGDVGIPGTNNYNELWRSKDIYETEINYAPRGGLFTPPIQ